MTKPNQHCSGSGDPEVPGDKVLDERALSQAAQDAIVADIGTTIASTLVLEDVLATVAELIGKAFGVWGVDIQEYDPERTCFVYEAVWCCDGLTDEDRAYIGTVTNLWERPDWYRVLDPPRLIEVHIDDPDLLQDDRTAMEKWGYMSTLDAPLMHGDVPIGIIGIMETRYVRRFTASEHELFRRLCTLASGAIVNAKAHRRLEERTRHLTSLIDASRAMTSTMDVDEVLVRLAREATLALGVSQSVVYELDETGSDLVLRALFQTVPTETVHDPLGTVYALAELPGERAILEGAAPHVEMISDADLPPDRRASMDHWGEMTCLSVPLRFADRPVGTLRLYQLDRERRFDEAELDLAGGLGEQAAIAINNAHLYHAIAEQAITDGLTGIYNHRHFRDRLTEEVARSLRYDQPLSLLMIDVDDFKDFNDRFGHMVGDEVLRIVARTLKEILRRDVDIPCRYGGEEFVVLLPSTPLGGALHAGARLQERLLENTPRQAPSAPASPGTDEPRQDAVGVGERIRRAIAAMRLPGAAGAAATSLTVSIGVSACPLHATTEDRLVRAADDALYRAKRAGKDRVFTAEDFE